MSCMRCCWRSNPTAALGKTYTITNDEHMLLWDVIRTVLRELGVSTKLRRVPLPGWRWRWPG